jgi:hypothetical protein
MIIKYQHYEYKQGAHGFTYVRRGGEWLRSSYDWEFLLREKARIAKNNARAAA